MSVSCNQDSEDRQVSYNTSRYGEVETLLITSDNRTEVTRKVLNWLMEGVN